MSRSTSYKDKLNALYRPSNMQKMVLVQQHEIERLRKVTKPTIEHYHYVELLYAHYIEQKKDKTYKC